MRKSALLVLFLVVFIDLLGFGIVIPILPYYAQSFGASASELGWLMASYSILQFLFAPVWGKFSDRLGRRPVLLVTMLGTLIALVWTGFAGTLAALFVGRTFAGLFGANISIAYAYVADVTDESNRAKGMGVIGAGFGLGFIFGPAIGGILSQYGYAVPLFFAAGLSFLNLVFAYFKLEEPALDPKTRESHRHKRFDMTLNQRVLANPQTRLSILLFFLVTLAVTQMEVVFAIYMQAQFAFGAREAGLLLGMMGIMMVSVQGGLIGKLAKKFGEKRLIVIGILTCAVALYAFASTSILSLIIPSLMLLSVAHGMAHPCLSSLASKGSPSDLRGSVMGVFQSSGSLARIFGPLMAGWLYDSWRPQAPFYFGVFLLCLGATIALIKFREIPMGEISGSVDPV